MPIYWPRCYFIGTVSDWTIRDSVPEDEDCIASMWLSQLCADRHEAKNAGSVEQRECWNVFQPIVTSLMRTAEARVLCDPERVDYAPGRPSVIWGWAVCAGETVYGCAVKRRVMRADREMAKDIVRDLLGSRLASSQRTVMSLPDVFHLGLLPKTWKRDHHWLPALRQLSERTLAHESMFLDVAKHITDPNRTPWLAAKKAA